MQADLIAILVLFLPVTILGILTILYTEKLKKFNSYFLSFSGAFLLSILALHIFPEVYESEITNIGIYVLVGFLVQVFLEYLSQGIEHGHVHGTSSKSFPYGILISLCVHAFIEGIPIEMEIHGDLHEACEHGHYHAHAHHHHNSLWEGSPLLLGIMVHKVPVGITLVMLLMAKEIKKSKVIVSLLLFALMAPLGLLLAHVGMSKGEGMASFLEISQAIVMGMLLHIASTILFESDGGHHKNLRKLFTMILGMLVAFLSL